MFFQASNYTGNNHHMHVSAFGMILGFKLASHLANPDKFVTGKTFQVPVLCLLAIQHPAPTSQLGMLGTSCQLLLSPAQLVGQQALTWLQLALRP